MRKTAIFLTILILCNVSDAWGQTILFSEDFESGEMPLDWKQEFVKGSISWRYENGGYTLTPLIPNSRKPVAAHGGLYNALFQYQSSNNEATRLVTKRIESLEFAIKPELHFFRAQFDWKHGADYYHDYLRVYYKSSATSPWTLLNEYTTATTDWVEQIILLPENDLSGDYYLAFEGITKWGWGACVDDIQIIETGILPKSLDEVTVEQASDVSLATGTDNNPILRLKIKVNGNSGSLPLNSLTVKSLNTDDDDIKAGGVRLYMTQTAEFNTNNPVGNGVSFVSGEAVFTGLNHELPTGYSYLWITFDVKPDAMHRHLVDASVGAGQLVINGQPLFTSEQSPAGNRMILKSVYRWDFETAMNWQLTGEFEHGSPMGLGGSQGNPDPSSAYQGSYVIGTDLGGLGDYAGDYEKNLTEAAYTAVSDTLDFTYYNDLSLRYMRYLNIGVNDEAFIDISTDGGLTWQKVWSNESMILDDNWKLHEVSITKQASRHGKVLLRFALGTTNDYWQLSGWNIDDLFITGNYIYHDVGIATVAGPLSGCGHTSSEEVKVWIKNSGSADSYGVIPLRYSIDGNKTVHRDTLYQVIPAGDSVLFTFTDKADFSTPGIYDFRVATDMQNDDDTTNNELAFTFFAQSLITGDHTEDFESAQGLWMAGPLSGSSWEWGTPGFGIDPPSGSRLWKTGLVNQYPDNDFSYVESVCYRNTDSLRKAVGLKYWVDAEEDRDGALMQYSTDNGLSWQVLDTLISGWPWYTDTVQALQGRGWSGSTDGWVEGRLILPERITNKPFVKFRIVFASDDANHDVGFAFDDFTMTTVPVDVGVSAIDSFENRCQYLNPDSVSVRIRNFGINPLRPGDTLVAAFDFNGSTYALDTLRVEQPVEPGGEMRHTFSRTVDVSAPGVYNITAYTLARENKLHFFNANDSLSLDFETYPNPTVIMLGDTISTQLPDTVILRPYYDLQYAYWWEYDGSTSHEFHVPSEGLYRVKVTDAGGNGCISWDSSYVELLFNDVGVDSIALPASACALSEEETIRAVVMNCGTDSIPAGEKIVIKCLVNGITLAEDTFVLQQTLLSQHSVEYSFSSPADLSHAGEYAIKAYTVFAGDTIRGNDTLEKGIEIHGYPVADLGPDLVIPSLSFTLDAGAGFSGYIWNNGDTTRNIEIGESGDYWVIVSDGHGCTDSDTVNVFLKIRDISIDSLMNPLSSCLSPGAEPVTFRLLNTGTDTIPGGQAVEISFELDDSGPTRETVMLPEDLVPGAFTSISFAEQVNLSLQGEYRFTASVSMTGDMRNSNDTIIRAVYRYDAPVVDFGLKPTEYVYDTACVLDAGLHPHYLYDWQDDSTGYRYTAVQSGKYHVRVTDKRTQCSDGDTVNLFLVYNDVSLLSVSLPEEGCTGDYRNVTLRIANTGTTNIGKDVPIYVDGRVDGTAVVRDTLVRTDNFAPGTWIDLVLSDTIRFAQEGEHTVGFRILCRDDQKIRNDSLGFVFSALPRPVIDFGDINGILNTSLPHQLDAGGGQKAYLWNTGYRGQIYTAVESGTYTVTVTGQNDCQSTKTVRINPGTGLEEYGDTEAGAELYPNPNDGAFVIRMKSGMPEEFNLFIFNAGGQLVEERIIHSEGATEEIINLRHLPPGTYNVIIKGKQTGYQGKMIVR